MSGSGSSTGGHGNDGNTGFARRRFLTVAGAAGAAAGVIGGGIAWASSAPWQDLSHFPRPNVLARRRRSGSELFRPLFLGTYTSEMGGGKGIGVARYGSVNAQMSMTGTLENVANPSFLTLGRSGRVMYAISEQQQGTVTAATVQDDGKLNALGTLPTGGLDPCHVTVDPRGCHLLTSHYTSGTVTVHALGEDGTVKVLTDMAQHTGSGPDKDRQTGPHTHWVAFDPKGGHFVAADLGTDTVYSYRLDCGIGKLTRCGEARMRPGAGPRHVAFHTSGRFAYVTNELDNTLVVCAYDPATGKLTPGDPLPTLPPGAQVRDRNYPAMTLVLPSGRFVYLANRGHNSIVRYAVEGDGARLRMLEATPCGGDFPRHMSFARFGTMLFAANQKSNSVTSFRLDGEKGTLTPASTLQAPIPTCVLPG